VALTENKNLVHENERLKQELKETQQAVQQLEGKRTEVAELKVIVQESEKEHRRYST